MTPTDTMLGRATVELAAGHEARALEILRELFAATDDEETIDEIRRLAVDAHDASRGFHRIEWKRLAIDAESREELAAVFPQAVSAPGRTSSSAATATLEP